MSAALATIDRGSRALIVSDALTQENEQRQLLGQYVTHHMQDGTDYGIIPGTKNKTLLKPGAEKLTTLFRCVPRFVMEDKIENWETGLFFYRFACHIETLDGGNVVAEGVGSCSTYESRYRWRNGDRKCPQCDAAAIMRSKYPPKNDPQAEPGWYCFAKKGGCGANFAANDESIISQSTGRVQNPDLCDQANTVLKIAKKRAHVDAAIALARCSDIFTQDVEDFQETHRTPDEPSRGNYDPRTVPGVKSGADLRNIDAELMACPTLDALRTLFMSLSPEQRARHAATKDARKAALEGEQSRPPSASSATGPAATANATTGAASVDAPTAATPASTLPPRPARGPTPKSLSDLLDAVADATGDDGEAIIGNLFRSIPDAESFDTMTPEQLDRADAWLRERVAA